MSTRKRRPPEKRRSGNASRLISGSAALIGSAVMRKPAAAGGTVIFAIVFSFVAANALWYQPATHPHPWLDTRDAFRNYASHAMNVASGQVTTFRVEHDAQQQQQVSAVANPPAALATPAAITKSGRDVVVQEPAPAQDGTTPAAAPGPEKSALVADIQSNLARRGLYDGAVDGMPGPKTQAAILFYQETRGLPQTGNADVGTLELLKSDNAEFNVIPSERPGLDVTGAIAAAPKTAADPVAVMIRKAPAAKVAIGNPKPGPKPVPKAEIKPSNTAPAQAAKPLPVALKPATGDQANSGLIMQIQKGLANLAYKDVAVDGVLGQQTSDAISHFQKHYRLPVTGQADAAVLDKLKKIGAL